MVKMLEKDLQCSESRVQMEKCDYLRFSHYYTTNKTYISLIKILEVRGEWKEAHVGQKKKKKLNIRGCII